MISLFLAASVTFSAVATGIEKGTPVEFAFVGDNSDRHYEAMFCLDGSIDDLCSKMEKSGLPRGKPVNSSICRLWPVGCRLKFTPDLSQFIDCEMPEGLPVAYPIYTGGTRTADGCIEAQTNMPSSFFSLYSLAQSPIVFDGIFDQGVVYGAFTAKKKLAKGTRQVFKLEWSESMPKHLELTAEPDNLQTLIQSIKDASVEHDLEINFNFHDQLTVKEAVAVSQALSLIDSPRIKINGSTNIFYRSFLPLVKWRDRKERLVQPFELSVNENDTLVYIAEDWSGPDLNPKLTTRVITFDEAKQYATTDTCFIYTSERTPISRIRTAMSKLKDTAVKNWYVFCDHNISLHNTP